jgi:ribosomal protein L9
MQNVVSLAAFKNARRAQAVEQEHAAAKAKRLADEAAAIAAELGNSPGAQMLGSVIAELGAAERAKNAAHQYMPAYCDPHNEVRGAKYRRDMGCKEIAVRMRQDVKDAIARGALPKGLKVSIRSDHNSIDLRVVALPEGFRVMSDKAASWAKQFPARRWDYPGDAIDQQSPELRVLMDALRQIHGAYNRDNSDSMVDYFDVNYYGYPELDWALRDARQEAEINAAAGDYWLDAQ